MKRIAVGVLAIALSAFASARQSGSGTPPGGVSRPAPATVVNGNIEVLSNTNGVDFGPYISTVLQTVRANWHNLIPQDARPPDLKSGKVSIDFALLPNGKVAA